MTFVLPYTRDASTFKELDFSQAGAVQNTWYEVANLKNVEIYGLCIGVTVANETLELRITIDGVVYWGIVDVNLAEFSALDGIRISSIGISTQVLLLTVSAASVDLKYIKDPSFWCKGKTVLIEIRKTTAAGASALLVRGVYGQS